MFLLFYIYARKLSRALNLCMPRTNIRYNFVKVPLCHIKLFVPKFLPKCALNNGSNYTLMLKNKHHSAQAYHNFGPCHSKIIGHAQ